MPINTEFKNLEFDHQNKSFTVELSKEHGFKDGGYPLILKYNGIISNKVDIILTTPADLTITANTTSGIAGTNVTITGTYTAHSYDAKDHTFEFVGNDFSGTFGNGTFTATINKPLGNYDLQIEDKTNGLLSDKIVVSLINSTFLSIAVSSQPINISGMVIVYQRTTTLVITENTSTFDDWGNISLELYDETTSAISIVAAVTNSSVGSNNKTFEITASNNIDDYGAQSTHTISPSLLYENQGLSFTLTFESVNEFITSFC